MRTGPAGPRDLGPGFAEQHDNDDQTTNQPNGFIHCAVVAGKIASNLIRIHFKVIQFSRSIDSALFNITIIERAEFFVTSGINCVHQIGEVIAARASRVHRCGNTAGGVLLQAQPELNSRN